MSEAPEEWVVGIDSSTKSIAFVALRVDTHMRAGVYHHVHKGELQRTPQRPLQAYQMARRFILGLPIRSVVLVCIEAPVVAGARNIQSTVKQAIVNGAIQAGVLSTGLTSLVSVAVATWKKEALGFGALTKDQVRDEVQDRWPESIYVVGDDQDLNDAWAIAQYAALLHERAQG